MNKDLENWKIKNMIAEVKIIECELKEIPGNLVSLWSLFM